MTDPIQEYAGAKTRDAVWGVQDAAAKMSELGLVVANYAAEAEPEVEAMGKGPRHLIAKATKTAALGYDLGRSPGDGNRDSDALHQAADTAEAIAEMLRDAATVMADMERKQGEMP